MEKLTEAAKLASYAVRLARKARLLNIEREEYALELLKDTRAWTFTNALDHRKRA